MDTHEKFTAASRRLCEVRDLELVVEDTYVGSGVLSLQHPESFDPVLRFGEIRPAAGEPAGVAR